jgi:hypothetical protein
LNVPKEIWLGASFRDANNKLFYDTSEDAAAQQRSIVASLGREE